MQVIIIFYRIIFIEFIAETGDNMSGARILVSNTIIPQLDTVFEASPACDWGGVLVGEISEKDSTVTTTVYGAFPGTYKESFLDEFRTTSQMWKDFYNERDRHYPGAKIVGWYYYSPASWQPSEQNIDIHNTFFDTPGQVFLFMDRNGSAHCYLKEASGGNLFPVSFSEFTGQSGLNRSGHGTADETVPETGGKTLLKIGLKKVSVFFVFFAVCILGLMYKDLTKPIINTPDPLPVSIQEKATADVESSGTVPPPRSEEKATDPSQTDNPGFAAPESTPEPETVYYIVKKGDSLWSISEKFYGSGFKFYKILESNNIYNPRNLYTGQQLTILPESASSNR